MSERRSIVPNPVPPEVLLAYLNSLTIRYPDRQSHLKEGYFSPRTEEDPNQPFNKFWFDTSPHLEGTVRSTDTLRWLVSMVENERPHFKEWLSSVAHVLVAGAGFVTDVSALMKEYGVSPERIYIVDQEPAVAQAHQGVLPPENIFVSEQGVVGFLNKSSEIPVNFDVVLAIDVPVEVPMTLASILSKHPFTTTAVMLFTTVFYVDHYRHGERVKGWNDTHLFREYLEYFSLAADDDTAQHVNLWLHIWSTLDRMSGDSDVVYEQRDIHALVKKLNG